MRPARAAFCCDCVTERANCREAIEKSHRHRALMNTYHRSSQHDQFPWGPSGPRRRGSRGRSKFVAPEILLRRRLGLLVLVGLCAAPVAWALRGEGSGVDVTTTGGAAVVVQLDSTDQVPLASTTTANTTLPPAIAETTLPTPTTQVVTPICGSTYIVQAGILGLLSPLRQALRPV